MRTLILYRHVLFSRSRSGENVTELFDQGKEFITTPGTCRSTSLDEPILDRWEVNQDATFQSLSTCGEFTCAKWKYQTYEWSVTNTNLPVLINTTDGVYLYDPSKFILGTPDPSVWSVPQGC